MGRCSMNYELTEECYDLLLDDYNNGSNLYYQLFGLDGLSGDEISMPLWQLNYCHQFSYIL